MLRLRDIAEPDASGYRKRLWGKNLWVYPFSRNFLSQVTGGEEGLDAKAPVDFCQGCAGCPYRSHACPLMPERMAAEGSRERH